jgi:hypothetical protein
MVLLGASVDACKSHNSGPPQVWLSGIPASGPWGRGWTSPIHRAPHGVDSVRASLAARQTGSPTGAMRVHHAGLSITTKLGGEIGQRWWSHFWCGRCLIKPLLVGSDPNRTRGGVGVSPMGALRLLSSSAVVASVRPHRRRRIGATLSG